ncbi:MAG TPA: metal-dependent hydrolase [Gammaproteobacteria bacterium]|nr:metal-dependent hydrolase [Gammaproteobacteria bacterium]
MDPVSQGVVGAAFAQTAAKRATVATVAWYGALGGMAPDLDVVFQSSTDPLLFLEFHRQFTHSLVFIPFGAFVVYLVLRLIASRIKFLQGLSPIQGYLACLMGYATHGLLDACTSYGTQLFWPFSDTRVAWDTMSIVDPLFTIPLLVLVIAAARSQRMWLSWLACGWMLCFFTLGWWQQGRAMQAAEQVATIRGHEPLRLSVKPSFANLLVWKAIYEFDGSYYVDAVRVGVDTSWYPGARVRKLNLARDFPGLSEDSRQAKDVERFRWFSHDYLSPMENSPRIIDMRYSLVPNEVDPMWGIDIDVNRQAEHVDWWASRELTDIKQREFLGMLLGLGGIALRDKGVGQ